MSSRDRIAAGARAVTALAPAISGLVGLNETRAIVHDALDRGHFTPLEDERLWAWYARYLTCRRGLQEVIHELRPETESAETDATSWRAFFVAYTASALLVRAARLLVEDLASHALVRRKLNERNRLHRVPRKQFSAVYRNLTDPVNAWRLDNAVRLADRHRDRITALAIDPELADLLPWLERCEPALRVEPARAITGRLRFRWHSWLRRGASGVKLSRFKILEACGRVVSELTIPWLRRVVPERIHRQLLATLVPGDVVVTRHHDRLTNFFLPGFWPHAMLYLGERSPVPAKPVLEARKDGVLLRTDADAFAVDAFCVVRPIASETEIRKGIDRALSHRGKLYDFDFDFFTSDRIVCTELIYRAYDGMDNVCFELIERAGKPTLSAEDILRMAVDSRGFEPIAVYGVPGARRSLIVGDQVRASVQKSLLGPNVPRASPSP